jgi:hypothetical protein
VPEAIGQSGIDMVSLAKKMGFKKPISRDVAGRISYLFKNVMDVKLRASLENAGYPEINAYEYGDGFVTDHKKGNVILRVGPAERGASAWLTVMSDYKTESMDYSGLENTNEAADSAKYKCTSCGFKGTEDDFEAGGENVGDIYGCPKCKESSGVLGWNKFISIGGTPKRLRKESIKSARDLYIVEKFTSETNHELIEKYLNQNPLSSDPSILDVRTSFRRFKKLTDSHK